MKNEIDIVGIPLDFGAGRPGVDIGPSAILGCELILSALGNKIL